MTVSAEKATVTVVGPSRTVASRCGRSTSVTRPLTCVSSTAGAGAAVGRGETAATGVAAAVSVATPGPPTAGVRTCAVGSGGTDATAAAERVSGGAGCTATVGSGETAVCTDSRGGRACCSDCPDRTNWKICGTRKARAMRVTTVTTAPRLGSCKPAGSQVALSRSIFAKTSRRRPCGGVTESRPRRRSWSACSCS